MATWKETLGRMDDLGNRTAQLTLLSISAAVIVIAAVVAGPIRDESDVLSSPDKEAATDSAGRRAVDVDEEGRPVDAAGTPIAGKGVVTTAGTTDDAAAALPSAPPITATHLKVGIAYNKDPGAANAAAGFGGIGQIEQKRGWDAVIADINRDPAFGRKVVPVYYATTTDEITSKGVERLEQEACALWTQDNPVFLVWGGILGLDTLRACLTKAKVPLIGGSGGLSYTKTYKDYPYVVEPYSAALDRMATFQVDRLHAQGYFSKFKTNAATYSPQKPADNKPRIGLIRYDQPSYKAAAAAMKRALKSHGLSLCRDCEFEVTFSPDNIAEQLNDATEVNAAIQSFKAKGVTHVMFLGSTAGVRITIFFVDGAEKQRYRPRLGLNPLDAPTAARDFLGSPSYPQFRQSVLVTTGPDEFDQLTDAFNRCKKIFMDAGETFQGDEASAKEGQIPAWCDDAWYTKGVLAKVGPSLSLDSFMKAVATVDPIDSAGVYLMKTTAQRRDGSGAIRVGEWFENCNCFKPTSDIIPV